MLFFDIFQQPARAFYLYARRLPAKRAHSKALADAGEVVATLPFAGELAEDSLERGGLLGVFGQGESFCSR